MFTFWITPSLVFLGFLAVFTGFKLERHINKGNIEQGATSQKLPQAVIHCVEYTSEKGLNQICQTYIKEERFCTRGFNYGNASPVIDCKFYDLLEEDLTEGSK